MTAQIMSITGDQWQEILKILGTGDFFRIEFRPATADERHLGPLNGIDKGAWFICEAEYAETVCDEVGRVIRYNEVTRKFPYRLYELKED